MRPSTMQWTTLASIPAVTTFPAHDEPTVYRTRAIVIEPRALPGVRCPRWRPAL